MGLVREHDLQPGTCVGCTVGEVPHVSESRFLDERLVGCVAAVARSSTSAHHIMSHYLTCKQADPRCLACLCYLTYNVHCTSPCCGAWCVYLRCLQPTCSLLLIPCLLLLMLFLLTRLELVLALSHALICLAAFASVFSSWRRLLFSTASYQAFPHLFCGNLVPPICERCFCRIAQACGASKHPSCRIS